MPPHFPLFRTMLKDLCCMLATEKTHLVSICFVVLCQQHGLCSFGKLQSESGASCRGRKEPELPFLRNHVIWKKTILLLVLVLLAKKTEMTK